MIKAVIVDDEQSAIEVIKALVTQYSSEIQICAASQTIKDAIQAINKYSPDIIFLDIQLAHGTGFEILEALEETKANVIFVTAHENFAIKAIKHNAFDYILKPINPLEMEYVLKKVTQQIKTQVYLPDNRLLMQYLNSIINRKIAVPTQNGLSYYDIAQIIFVEGEGSYSSIHMVDGKKVVVSKILKHFESLLNDKGFLRVHRSYLVNTNHIAELRKEDRGYLVMTNRKEIPIGTAEREEILNKLRMFTSII